MWYNAYTINYKNLEQSVKDAIQSYEKKYGTLPRKALIPTSMNENLISLLVKNNIEVKVKPIQESTIWLTVGDEYENAYMKDYPREVPHEINRSNNDSRG